MSKRKDYLDNIKRANQLMEQRRSDHSNLYEELESSLDNWGGEEESRYDRDVIVRNIRFAIVQSEHSMGLKQEHMEGLANDIYENLKRNRLI